MSDTRLAAIQSAFAGFGGAFAGLRTMLDAQAAVEQLNARTDHSIAMMGIQRDNEAAGNQAAADALAGRPDDPTYGQMRAYRETRAQVAGQRAGMDLAERWRREVYQVAPAGANLTALTDAWIKERVGQGSGDPIFDRTQLSTLYRAVDAGVARHREDSVRATLEQGTQDLSAVIGRSVRDGQWSADDIGMWTRQARVLHPHDPQRAHATVVTAILSATPDTPDGINRTLSILRQPGSGPNGQSWADANPQAFAEAETRFVKRSQQTRTLAAQAAWNQLEDRIGAETDPVKLAAMATEIETIHGQHGGGAAKERAQALLTRRMAPLVRIQADNARLGRMVARLEPSDPSFARAHMDTFLDAQRDGEGNPLTLRTHPTQVGTVAGKLGVVSDGLREQLRSAFANFADPEGQKAAFAFTRAAEAQMGSLDGALSLLPEEHRGLYRTLRSAALSSPQALDRTLAQLQQAGGNDVERLAREHPWSRLLGETDARKAEAKRDELIRSGLREFAGETGGWMPGSNERVILTPQAEDAVRSAAHLAATAAFAAGASVPEAIRGAVRDVGERIELLPGADGSARAVLRQVGAERHPDGTPIVRAASRVRNPMTGRDENTVETARRDLTTFSGAAPDLIGGGKLSVSPGPEAARGVYRVRVDGSDSHPAGPVAFAPGTNVRIGGAEIALDRDPAKASAQIIAAMPQSIRDDKRFVLIPQSGVFVLGYRFGFRERGVTLDERVDRFRPGFQAPATQQRREGFGTSGAGGTLGTME